jgi:hypothetical protein
VARESTSVAAASSLWVTASSVSRLSSCSRRGRPRRVSWHERLEEPVATEMNRLSRSGRTSCSAAAAFSSIAIQLG